MYYWATFRQRGGHAIRMDTRVYLHTRSAIGADDHCLGCIVGKNPGSAVPGRRQRAPVAIDLDGDRFLPNVRAIVRKAYDRAGVDAVAGGYVRVLNLFYLCDRNLNRALQKLATLPSLPRCPTEQHSYPWAWFAWGGDDTRLNGLKRRFEELPAATCFFFDGESRRVLDGIPATHQLARHTQGLHHDPLVAYLAALIAAQGKAR